MQSNKKLSKLLANKNILTPGLTISANTSVRIFGGIPVQKEKSGVIVKVEDEFVLVSFEHGSQKKTLYEDIISIEGMDIARFAQAYKVKTPKK